MEPEPKKRANDKSKLRLVTAIGLVIAGLVYVLMRYGMFGESLQEFAPLFLSIMLILLGARAIVTELGIRR